MLIPKTNARADFLPGLYLSSASSREVSLEFGDRRSFFGSRISGELQLDFTLLSEVSF